MKSLFDKETYNETMQRLNSLTPASQRKWGKMDAAQMLAHCKEAFKVPLSDTPLKKAPFIMRMIGSLIKSKLYNDSPWKQNLPTAPNFLIKDQRSFENEKQQLTELVTKFYTLESGKVGNHPHPFFGTYTKEQWGQAMFKHLDHHLRQFNV